MDRRIVLEDLLRTESGRIVGALMRRFGDLDLAEDCYQEACLAAWEHWPVNGVPANRGGWLMATARNRAVDRLRRESRRLGKETDASGLRPGQEPAVPGPEDVTGPLDDDELRLLLLCCHPALAQDAQIALTLRTVGGLTTPEIARAFLVPLPTMAQRLARARRKIALAGIPFRLPPDDELADRTAAVRRVVYLVFSEGYAATGTDSVVRPDLSTEAIRLGRLLVALLPGDAETMALLALMLLHDARRPARVGVVGELVPLEEQDRSSWDGRQIAEGLGLVEAALVTGPVGPYQVQAAVAALHAQATDATDTDWPQILGLYRLLETLAPGPVVTLNRLVALAMVEGAAAALVELDRLSAAGLLSPLPEHRVPAVRAHLLDRAGRHEEAATDYRRAAATAATEPERAYLRRRLARVTG
ncbi:MAG TPA: sigma-70 family RNA polymerase sigma factor [Actinomycetes bacterium]